MFIKKIIRSTQGFIERFILGGLIQDIIWKYKHLYQKNWAKTSINSINLNHRFKLISKISPEVHAPRILEIGCAAGPNLRLLRKKYPNAFLTGIDINRSAINEAKNYFVSINDDQTAFYVQKAHMLDNIKTKSFDVVFSQAVLLYPPPSRIRQVVKNMIRISNNLIIFHEYHMDGANDGVFKAGRWCYDYKYIIKLYFPTALIQIHRGGFKGGDWEKFGRFIIVKL